MLPNNFTHKSQEALQQAHNIAAEGGQQALLTIHLFAALFEQNDGIVSAIIDKVVRAPEALRSEIDAALQSLPRSANADGGLMQVYLSPELVGVINRAAQKT